MTTTETEDYEALLQFMYMAPVGLMQTRHDGEILMVNPLGAQLLMPLSRDGCLANLFTALSGVAPDLQHSLQTFEAPQGMVVEPSPLSSLGLLVLASRRDFGLARRTYQLHQL